MQLEEVHIMLEDLYYGETKQKTLVHSKPTAQYKQVIAENSLNNKSCRSRI